MITEADLAAAAAAIRRGGLVGMPTETVYGLAANALDPDAVLAIYAAKGRPRFDPLIVHVPDAESAWRVARPSARAQRLAAAFWPGPLTLVLPRRPIVPDVVTAGLETVAVRVPDHPVAQALLRACATPLAAPSANRFGALSPTTADHVREQLGAAVAVVLDGGACAVGIESSVIVPDPRPVLLRPGGIPIERLSEVLGEAVALASPAERTQALALPAPGMLASHYAPRAPLVLRAGAWPASERLAALSFRGDDLPERAFAVEILSPDGDLARAARGLFAALRRLDALAPALIAAELAPGQGLGAGINDRLRRAAGLGGS